MLLLGGELAFMDAFSVWYPDDDMTQASRSAGIRLGLVLLAASLAVAGMPIRSATARVPFSIDPKAEAAFERAYTTQFPSRWTNQVRGTAWRTAHDAAANYIRDSWAKLVEPFASEGAFAELRPFNFTDPTGTQPDNTDPIGLAGPENNVLAFVPGSDPVLRNEIVIVGGHYDCVDITVDGGLDCGMQIPTATAVLEGLMRYWKANNIRPRRSFAAFDQRTFGAFVAMFGQLGQLRFVQLLIIQRTVGADTRGGFGFEVLAVRG